MKNLQLFLLAILSAGILFFSETLPNVSASTPIPIDPGTITPLATDPLTDPTLDLLPEEGPSAKMTVTKNAGDFELNYGLREANLGEGGFDINPTNFRDSGQVFAAFVTFMTGTVVLLAILVFMIGGGFWIFSAGNESLVERGKTMMIYSMLGVLLVLGAYVLVQLFQMILYALGT